MGEHLVSDVRLARAGGWQQKLQCLVRLLLLCLLVVSGAMYGCSPRGSQPDLSTGAGTGQTTEDSVSSKKDFQKLVDILVPYAKRMLEQSGEFHPFAAAVDTSGESSVFSADLEEGEKPDSTKLLTLLSRGVDQGRADGQLRATGVCFPVKTIPGSLTKVTAIRLALRRIDGSDRDVLIPYWKKKGRVDYGSMLLFVPADSTILSSPGKKASTLD